ncbi:hypothetical protein CCACVL1_19809 [Corchorus capsularis]|uniref:Uncharacterized protein n=1 Tax=Corchorus capsularis TaxID=210143 RepID=A0A1R3HET0_COCAP|nr:hypothetical protein CCACVL1_19809 [Corchorus capsularis]
MSAQDTEVADQIGRQDEYPDTPVGELRRFLHEYYELKRQVEAKQEEYIIRSQSLTAIKNGQACLISNEDHVKAFALFVSLHLDQYPRARASIKGSLADDKKKQLYDLAKSLGIERFLDI